eukprot:GFUD01018981.1.p1 GENE.GFUD01018981.1~~GFUD01018981.1.p1  ORF type:complete len:197 (+),score=79.41 GFUD01018981.1:114-704(+)
MSLRAPPCPMCNDKQGLGKPKEEKISRVCQRCVGCKTCSAMMSPADKYSVKISDEEIENYKQMFMMFDKDGDGTVSTKELGAVMRSIGSNPTEEELEEMIDNADADGSGTVDFQEFVELMIKREAEKETEEDLKQAFRVLDKDGSGSISSSELKFVMNKIGVVFTNDELLEMVMEADINGDELISFDEFRDIFLEG